MNGIPEIKELWAWTFIDKDGTEGVMGMMSDTGWMPMVVYKRKTADLFRPIVQRALQANGGEKAMLKHFTSAKILEEITLK